MTLDLSPSVGEVVFQMDVEIKPLSKERPRTGRGGHMYTPKRTRDYETAIIEAAEVFAMMPPVSFPVALSIHVTIPPTKSWPLWKKELALWGWFSPSKGDLDNKVKAISDALNGIVYIDDVQVCELVSTMTYANNNRVKVRVTRVGLSPEQVNAETWKILRHERDNKGSARVGG